MKSEVHKAIETQFLGKPNNDGNHHAIMHTIAAQLNKALAENNAIDYSEHISFELITEAYGNVVFNPINFFTALLFQGVFCPAAIHGLTELATKHGTYKWFSNGLGFIPNQPAQSIEVALSSTHQNNNNMTHTPAPWSVRSSDILDGHGREIATTALSDLHGVLEDIENAARIVACVNALEGFELVNEDGLLSKENAHIYMHKNVRIYSNLTRKWRTDTLTPHVYHHFYIGSSDYSQLQLL